MGDTDIAGQKLFGLAGQFLSGGDFGGGTARNATHVPRRFEGERRGKANNYIHA